MNTTSPAHSSHHGASPAHSHHGSTPHHGNHHAEAKQRNAIMAHLKTVMAKDLIADRKTPVVTMESNETVEKAVKLMSTNQILAVPILDHATKKLTGVVDVLGVVKFIISCAPDAKSIQADELKTLTIAGRAIALQSVEAVNNKDGLVTFFQETPASALVDVFATGVHRVGLTDEQGNLVGVCSQSDVARHIAPLLATGNMKVIGEKSIKELGYAASEIFSVKSSDTVLYALNLLSSNVISGAAVTDDEGKLIGNFSASNMRGLYFDKFPHLLDTVADFLNERSPASLNPVVGLPTSSLASLVKEIVASKLHHLWVVDDFKPQSIISLTDVMKVIAHAP